MSKKIDDIGLNSLETTINTLRFYKENGQLCGLSDDEISSISDAFSIMQDRYERMYDQEMHSQITLELEGYYM